MRFKKTEVCQTCSKIKNVCQTCLLDLEYGLPVQVRDAALKVSDNMPKSDVNKEYYQQNMEKEMAINDSLTPAGALGKAMAPSDMLLKLARTTPYYKRNRPHICSFWVKGECKRGEECPYRHDKPTDPDDPLSDQNIKDRFYGTNDPVADKLIGRYNSMPKLEVPEDKNITTLYVGNLGEKIGEKELKDHFYQYGEIRSINVVSKQQCAFIQFTSRHSAESAAEKSFNKLIINGRRLNIKWGKSQGQTGATEKEEEEETPDLEPVPGLPGALPPPPIEISNNFFNLGDAPPMQLQPQMPMRPPMPPRGMPPRGPPPMMPIFMRGPLPPGIRLPPPPPGMLPLRPPPGVLPRGHVPQVHYPSQDPSRMGAVMQQNL